MIKGIAALVVILWAGICLLVGVTLLPFIFPIAAGILGLGIAPALLLWYCYEVRK